jgi:hypothetical protein
MMDRYYLATCVIAMARLKGNGRTERMEISRSVLPDAQQTATGNNCPIYTTTPHASSDTLT